MPLIYFHNDWASLTIHESLHNEHGMPPLVVRNGTSYHFREFL